jgi:tetratricopeptide (TPR) repeat protein
MLTFARRIDDLELQLQAHAWLVLDLLESGDRDAVDAQIAAFTAGAEQLRQPLYVWQAIVWRAMRALLEGRLARAEELATQALAAGAPAEAVTAPQYHAMQLLGVRREQDRIGELEQAARQMAASAPALTGWRAALATVLVESGSLDDARAELERLGAEDFQDLPRDGDWITTMALIGDLCVALGDRRRCRLVYELLAPYEAGNVVVGVAVVCLGSMARVLAKLAVVAGQADRAPAYFERALSAHARLRSPVLLAHTQLDYAEALGSGPRAARLIEEAAHVASELELPAVAHRVERLRAG